MIDDTNTADPNTDASSVIPLATADISQGVPTPPVDPAEAAKTPVNDQDPTAASPTAPEASDATVERLKQELARTNKLVAAVGLDPLSDLKDQLEKGYITEADVQAHIKNQYGVNAPPNMPASQATQVDVGSDPISIATASLEAAKAKYQAEVAEKGGVSLTTNNEYMQAIEDLNQARFDSITRQTAAEKQTQQANESVAAVANVAKAIPEYAGMEEPLQQTVEQTTVALTGMIARAKAPSMGLNPDKLTAQQYSAFAQDAVNMLDGLAVHYKKLGAEEVKASYMPPTPARPGQPVMPVPANNNGIPSVPVNNQPRATIQNHKDVARQWAANNQPTGAV
jgi:hypothetical protein